MSDSNLQPSPPSFIGRIERYVDDRARVIEAVTPMKGENPKELPRFTGSATMQFNTPMGPRPVPIRFAINADSLEKAYLRFDDSAQDAAQEYIKQQREEAVDNASRIVVPGR